MSVSISNLNIHLGVEDHVNTLIHNVLGMVTKKLQDVFHLRLIRQSTEPNTVLAGASSNELLGNNSHGRHRGDARKKRGLKSPTASTTAATATTASTRLGRLASRLSGTIQNLNSSQLLQYLISHDFFEWQSSSLKKILTKSTSR